MRIGDYMRKNISRHASAFLIAAMLSVLVLAVLAPVSPAAAGRIITNNSTASQEGRVGSYSNNATVPKNSTTITYINSSTSSVNTTISTTVATTLPTTLATSTINQSGGQQAAGSSNTLLYIGVVIVVIIVLVVIWLAMKRKK